MAKERLSREEKRRRYRAGIGYRAEEHLYTPHGPDVKASSRQLFVLNEHGMLMAALGESGGVFVTRDAAHNMLSLMKAEGVIE